MHQTTRPVSQSRLGEIFLLAHHALRARERAYYPYSGYAVGAAIMTLAGDRYLGCNIESITFTSTDHAEQVALANAVVSGAIRQNGTAQFIKTVVVATKDGALPCGICLQRLVEHSNPKKCLIAAVDLKGETRSLYYLNELLPQAFATNLVKLTK